MQSLFFEQVQQNFDAICQKTCQDHEPCIINRADNNYVVILSLADFNAWQETHYLLFTDDAGEDTLYWQQTDQNVKKYMVATYLGLHS